MARHNKITSTVDFESLTKDKNNVRSNCNALIFENKGTRKALINGIYPLDPGDTPLVIGNDFRVTQIDLFSISFEKLAGAPGPGDQLVIITRKYINRPKK